MFGQLTFNKTNVDLFSLNMLDAIKQLKNLKEVNFTLSKDGRSYIDVLSNLYSSSSYDEDAVLLLPNFRKAMKNILSNSESMQKFKELGATDLDIALIQGNVEAIRDIADLNKHSDPFAIAKDWRLLKLSRDIITQDDKAPDPFFDIKLSIDGEPTAITLIDYQAFNYQKSDLPLKTMLVNIQDSGDHAWNYHIASSWHNALVPCFDKILTLGGGNRYIISDDKLKLLNLYENQAQTIPKLDFALVVMCMHDNKEDGALSKIIKQLPQNLAKETVYFIQSCYSGQYQASYSGNAHLITSSTADTTSNGMDFDKIIDLPSYWQDKNPSLKGLLQFLEEQYKLSTPHYTGTISGIEFVNSPVKDAVTFLWSNEHDSLYSESSSDKPSSQATFIGLTNLLEISNATSSTSSSAQEMHSVQENEIALLGNDTLEML